MIRRTLLVPLLLAVVGCKDSDADGTRDGRDCAPLDAAVHPDAPETCDGVDDNCNGQVDEGVAIVAYLDRDGDGYGDTALARRVCALPGDGSPVGGDCDDLDPTVFPGAAELCDAIDNNCDGAPDAGVALAWYPDADGDGHGVPGPTVEGCTAPPGTAATDDDCDDGEPLAWSGADEVCDGVDNNCDGTIDEGGIPTLQWTDADSDGFGDPAAPVVACGPGPGVADNALDCDDADAAESPDTIEVQGNGLDEDCDGWVDEYGVGPGNPYPTADAALAAAPDGSVVQLDAGFFPMTVDLVGRDLTFAGEGCGRTVLYADGAGTAVRLDAGLLTDLTIAGGTGTSVTGPDGLPVVRGGGVLVEGNADLARLCVEDNDAEEGGGIAIHAGTVVGTDLRVVDNAATGGDRGVGGGVFVAEGSTFVLARSAVLGNTASGRAGGIATRGSTLTVTNTVVAGNTCVNRSCGIDVRAGLLAGGGAGARSTASLTNVTLHANAFTGGDDFLAFTEALGAGTSDATLRNVLVTAHPHALGSAVDAYRLTGASDGTVTAMFVGFGTNAGSDYAGPTWDLGRVGGDALYVDADPTLPATVWDLRLRADAPYQDAGDPALLDPDGSRSDIGAWGGPGAADGWDVGATDADGDGLLDGWELRYDTNPWVDDAAGDPDADGLTNLAEQAVDADPHAADTDLDGVDDLSEDISGTDPSRRDDHAPSPDAGPDRVVRIDEGVTLDAGASWDPDGDALAYTWTLVAAPGGSAAVVSDPLLPAATLMPDLPGTYEVSLAVDDGGAISTDSVLLRAFAGPIVPDDHPTVQDAVDAALDGEAVWVRPGLWDGPVVVGPGRDLAIAGLGVGGAEGVAVLDGHGAGSVIGHVGGGSLLLAHLALTSGRASEGGAVHAGDLDLLELLDVVLTRNHAERGGAIWAMATPTVASDVVIHDNHATTAGGGIWASGAVLADALLVATRTTFAGNTAGVSGGALHVDGPVNGDVRLEAVACLGNAAPDGACWSRGGGELFAYEPWLAGNAGDSVGIAEIGLEIVLSPVLERNTGTVIFGRGGDRTLQVFDALLWANTTDTPSDPLVDPLPPTTFAVVDPLSSFVDDGEPWEHSGLRLWSPAFDAGFVDRVDRDGTRSDAGACGGPTAPAPCLRAAHDDDDDGMSDAWEQWHGLDPTIPDGASDADGDGLTNAAEHTAGTRPDLEDTDLDGVDDPTESAGAGDPRDDRDHRPVAVVAVPLVGAVGVPLGLDGTASFDPDGEVVVTWQWRFLSVALGSSLTDVDLVDATTAAPSFVPDVAGTWLLGVTASAGGATSREAMVHATAL